MNNSKKNTPIFIMLMVMCILNYADRAVLSVCMPQISSELSLSIEETGWILSTAFWTYILLNVPSSLILNRYGARYVGSASVLIWSFAMIISAISPNVILLVFSRLLLGAGEAVAFPLAISIIYDKASSENRAFLLTALMTCTQLGIAFGTGSSGVITEVFGWRFALGTFSIPGVIWAFIWLFIYDKNTKNIIDDKNNKIYFRDIFSIIINKKFLGFVIVNCSANYMLFLLITWLPFYLKTSLKVSISSSGFYTAICYLFSAILSVAISLHIKKIAMSVSILNKSRYFMFICNMFSSFFLVAILFEKTVLLKILSISLCLGLQRVSSGFVSNMLGEIISNKRIIPVAYGVSLTISNIFGLLSPIIAGYIIKYSGKIEYNFICASILLSAGSIFAYFLTAKRMVNDIQITD